MYCCYIVAIYVIIVILLLNFVFTTAFASDTVVDYVSLRATFLLLYLSLFFFFSTILWRIETTIYKLAERIPPPAPKVPFISANLLKYVPLITRVTTPNLVAQGQTYWRR